MKYNFSHWGDKLPKISCQCITYGRPELLNEAVESFLKQDYPGEKELIIINDQEGVNIHSNIDNVKVYNLPERVPTIGEKRNLCVEKCTGDIIFVWDDDDISLPWRISLSLSRMKNKHYFKPSSLWFWNGNNINVHKAVAHAMGCWSKELFNKVGGYPHIQSGQDIELENRFKKTEYRQVSDLTNDEIYYIYKFNGNGSYHLSWWGYGNGYDKSEEYVKKLNQEGEFIIEPKWNTDYVNAIEDIKKSTSEDNIISKLGKDGWSMEPELYDYIVNTLPPGSTILELGSGFGTKALCEKYSVYSIEQNKNFMNKYHSNYIFAPIKDKWYDPDYLKDKLPEKYDMVLVDGPIGHRMGLIKNLDLFNVNIPWIFDDINRKHDYSVMQEFCKLTNKQFKVKQSRSKKFGVTENKKCLNDYFDKIYCINLDEATDRWEKCEEQFKKFNITAERFSATRYENDGIRGCRESHLSIIRKAKEEGLKNIFIFEDDFQIIDEHFNVNLEKIMKELPEDYNMLNFHCAFNGNYPNAVQPFTDNLVKLNISWGTQGYGMNSNVFDKILETCKGGGIDTWFRNNIFSLGNSYCPIKSMIQQFGGYSFIYKRNYSHHPIRHPIDLLTKNKYTIRIIYDQEGWAYHHRAAALQKYKPNDFDITIGRYYGEAIKSKPHDLIFYLHYANVKVLRDYFNKINYDSIILTSYNVGWGFNNNWMKYATTHADYTIVNNYEMWDKAGRLPNTYHISNGVDREIFRPITPIKERKNKVLWCGSKNHNKVKNYETIIKPLKEKLSKVGIELEIMLTDSAGKRKKTLPEMAEWYNTGSIYVVASSNEGTPNPALEAASCGCTVVSTRVGNMPELIKHGENGYLCDCDIDDIYKHIIKANNNIDTLSENILKDIVDWDWKNRSEKFYTLIRKLIDEKRNSKINFFDLGQNKGNVTDMLIDTAKTLNKKYHIYGFEASKKLHEHCKAKFKNNSNVTCLHSAISDKNSVVKLYKATNTVGDSIFEDKTNVDKDNFELVNSVIFSEWFKKNINPNDINVVKINIEGAEYMFFNDIINTELYKNINIICGTNDDPQKIPSLTPKLDEYYKMISDKGIVIHYFSDYNKHKNVDLKELINKL